ncbi:flagellar hook-associated protein FlgK [Deltaproteobacteria bacterium OttesenSCG-928-K17]|nr:flagellar hook-associated protein FlgK [Deltaproteobacteria bacterium OttesenSCG-928-K17]
MGISSSLYVALTGMSLSQAGMEVASHNIANVNTPGYSRQRLNLETMPTWKGGSWGQMGTGVNAQNITRFHDEFLTRSIVEKSSQYSAKAAMKQAIDALESFFNESNGNGINAAMNDFFALWDSVADASELDPSREELISVAQTLATQLATRREDMDAIRKDLNARVEAAVGDINTITKSIAELNQEIMRSEDKSRNQEANDLRDARDSLLIQLGELVNIDYWEDPSNGALNIKFASGPSLVANGNHYEVGTETDESGDIHVIANNRRTQPPWPEDVTSRIDGGAVGGWIDFRDNQMRDFYIQYESFVDNLIFQVNNQHAQGAGLDLFTDITSSSKIAGNPSTVFSFDGRDNDIRLTALTPHLTTREPYNPMNDPDNIAVRFVKSPTVTNEIGSTVKWNNDPGAKKWEITITLPTDSNGNVTCTSEDVVRYINGQRSDTTRGVPTLPPETPGGTYKVGDFINAQAAAGNNWTGELTFAGASVPSGLDSFQSLDRSLANTLGQGHHLSYGSEYAGLTTSLKHTDNDVTFIAVEKGAAGEKIAIEYLSPGTANAALSVDVYTDIDGTKRVSVNLATDDNGNITTTAADIVKLINADPQTRDLVRAQTPEDQTGQGLVKEMDQTYLDRSGSFEIVTYDDEGEPTIYKITVDPTDTLDDIVDRIGASFDGGVKGLRAEVLTDLNGQSVIRLISDSANGVEYGFRNDTSGALAVLGLNNIFTGDSSSNIGVNKQLVDNPRLLGAGKITSDGVRAPGDNTNALDMADLKDKRFSFYNVSSATLNTAFNTFYADIGSTNRGITTQHDFLYGVLDEMHSKQDSLAGVNLDEELADVLRYQYMYQASAKMLSTVDDMMNTLLSIR